MSENRILPAETAANGTEVLCPKGHPVPYGDCKYCSMLGDMADESRERLIKTIFQWHDALHREIKNTNEAVERAESAESRLAELSELLTQFDIADADELKHALEDHARWERDVVSLSIERDESRRRLAELSAIVDILRELYEECQPDGDRSPADVYYMRGIMRDRLYEVFPKIAALVPPVEKEK